MLLKLIVHVLKPKIHYTRFPVTSS